jgi:hypothetical protein
MAFTDMNDVDQDLGEEKLADRNGNRSFMIIAGILGGIMVLALLCIAALALFRSLPGQRAGSDSQCDERGPSHRCRPCRQQDG